MAILKFSASAVAAQIAHARGCKTFLPNWNGPVDSPALILIVGNGVHLRSNGIDGTTTRCDDGSWGYKDIEESAGPNESRAPLGLIELLSNLKDPDSYAQDWRQRCRDWASIPDYQEGD